MPQRLVRRKSAFQRWARRRGQLRPTAPRNILPVPVGILAECERGEIHLAHQDEEVLAGGKLDGQLETLLWRQLSTAHAKVARVEEFRNTLQAPAEPA